MSGVNTILENAGHRLGKDFTGKKDQRPVQDWLTLKETAVQVGGAQLRYLVQRKGRNYRQGFVDATNRPAGLFGDAENLLAAEDSIMEAIKDGFACVAADKAEYANKQKSFAKPGAPVEIRHTGKTERERLKKQSKLKA